jgi:hypothetical protein
VLEDGESGRLPRLHVYSGKVNDGTQVLDEHLPQNVSVAHGDAAGRDEHVANVEGAEDLFEERVGLVLGNAAVAGGNRVLGKQGEQSRLIAVSDATRS